jgi:hypothetical protein
LVATTTMTIENAKCEIEKKKTANADLRMNSGVQRTLYACPCGAPYRVVNTPPVVNPSPDELRNRKFGGVCSKCNHHVADVAQEQFFLKIATCSKVLWAFNAYQLAFIKKVVSDTNDRVHSGGHLSGLPRWLLAANNRPKVLKAIAKLEAKLIDAGLELVDDPDPSYWFPHR